MRPERAREIFEKVGAILLDQHFVYTGDMHGPHYIAKDKLYTIVRYLDELCVGLADPFKASEIDVVVAPAIGGVDLKTGVARCLSEWSHRDVLGVYTEKSGEDMILSRGYDDEVRGKRTLVVEDVLNTGGSAAKTVRAVRNASGIVVGVSALANRGNVTAEQLDVQQLEALVSFDFERYDPASCPLCLANVPINTQFGHGAGFLRKQAAIADQ